jgi:hypothetical protein
VQPGFSITVDCTSGDGVQEVDLSIDNVDVSTLTTAPFVFQTAASLTDGSHTISAMCTTTKLAYAVATETVIVGDKCSKDSDCAANDICYEMACIAGPGSSNGLGATCTTDAQCASNACASDGSMSVCVVPCNLNNDQCPTGFGCLMAGTGGVCWPGAANGGGGGCCDAGHSTPTAPALLGFGLALSLFTRRRTARSVR